MNLRSYSRDDLSVRTLLNFFKGKTIRSIKSDYIEDYKFKIIRNGVAHATILVITIWII
jgi:hypothetical protein